MIQNHRRDLLKLGIGAAATAATTSVWAAPRSVTTPRMLELHNVHTDESLTAVYWSNGRYLPAELLAVNHVLRDYRTGDTHMMDPRLLDLLNDLSLHLKTRSPFHVLSGYRSPKTNAMLRAHSTGVAKKSLHMQGLAIDIRLPDVELAKLHKTALSLGRGGVGYYPADNFVHVDVGPVRHWLGNCEKV